MSEMLVGHISVIFPGILRTCTLERRTRSRFVILMSVVNVIQVEATSQKNATV
jgi:hypothetical protein